MKQIPLLFLSDSPDLRTGLGRITRDLATFVSSMPQYRVATLGRGGLGSSRLPWAQYNFPEIAQWGEDAIEKAWMDFARDERGVIMTVWDASRLHWFTRPRPEMGDGLYNFLTSGRFERWGYMPIDSTSVGEKVTGICADAMLGFDRLLAYTAWGSQVIEKSIGKPVDWIPHGYDANKFQPRDKEAARMALGLQEGEIGIGCCMTNQMRKDWGVACAAIAQVLNKWPNVRFFIHTDVSERSNAWSLPALMQDFGITNRCTMTYTGAFNDEQMSYWYSGMDLTVLPSHEGMGYPIIESLACGTPVIHSPYGGGGELIPHSHWLVEPISFRLDTIYNSLRPVWNPEDWVAAIDQALEDGPCKDECTNAVSHLQWANLWPSAWKKWFEEGVK